MGQKQSWYPVDTSYATSAEYRVAALALVYHATSTGAEKALIKLVTTFSDDTSTYSSDTTFKPPPELKETVGGCMALHPSERRELHPVDREVSFKEISVKVTRIFLENSAIDCHFIPTDLHIHLQRI